MSPHLLRRAEQLLQANLEPPLGLVDLRELLTQQLDEGGEQLQVRGGGRVIVPVLQADE